MAEIPELNVIAHALEIVFAGKRLTAIDFQWDKKLNAPKEAYNKSALNQKLEKITRRSKAVWLSFENGSELAIHLMICGNLVMLPSEKKMVRPVASLWFDNGSGIGIDDRIAQATLLLNPVEPAVVEVMTKGFTLAAFKEILQLAKRRRIKDILCDQKRMRGLGLVYSDEILWQAKISPFTCCNCIPKDKILELYEAIPYVLNRAECYIRDHQLMNENFSMKNKDHRLIHNRSRIFSPEGEIITIESFGVGKTFMTESQIIYKRPVQSY